MKFDLVRPCPKCPFRTDVPGYLRRGRAVEIATSLANGATFACHQTTVDGVDIDEDGEEYETLVEGPDSQFCAGALLVMENMDQVNQIVRIAEDLGTYDATKMDRDAPVFKNFPAFVEHHGEAMDGPEPETCHVANQGCLAPAGMLVGGMAVLVEPEGEVVECPACGEPTCEECMEGDVCFYCADDE